MKIATGKVLCLLILFSLFLGACTGTQEAIRIEKPEPEWIKNPPADKDYYVGIAGSKTGVESEDKEMAYNRALKNLSGAISTELKSTTAVRTTEENGEGQYSYEDNIATSVSQNLENIEIVDTYYSQDLGYWYYIRLSQAEWDKVVEERGQSVIELVEDLYSDIFRDTYAELQVINISMRAFYEAYSGKSITMDLLGQRGKKVDGILFSRARDLMEELRLDMDENPLPPEIVQSVPVLLEGKVTLPEGSEYELPGVIPMVLKDQNERIIREFKTEMDGTFSLDFTDDKQGNMNYILTMVSPFAQTPLDEKTSDLLPQREFRCKVLPYVLPFTMETDWENGDLEKRTLAFLSEHTNVVISPVANVNRDGKYLKARLSFRQAPPNKYDMIFSYATLFLSLGNNGSEEVIWKSDEYKDGGLTKDQANQRASEKLFTELMGSEEIKEALDRAK
jgi:hypothetical protein